MERTRYWVCRLLLCLVVGGLVGCALPPLYGRTVSSALSISEAHDTSLGRAFAPLVRAHPGKSGIYSLADAHDAFATRVLLTRTAEKTLDVQSYIWHGDVTGTLMLEEVRTAADRGVRVRLLLDDNGTAGLDDELATLHSHPNIEVRLFNPFVVRSPKFIGYLTDFKRANRRMHNKSYTADNQATIIGGRNIGDEYFGAGSVLFADLDVLAVGPVVDDVSRDFDLYWASESSYPVDLILPQAAASSLETLAKTGETMAASKAASEYTQAVIRSKFVAGLESGSLTFEWAETTMISDDPAKGLGKATRDSLLVSQLGDMLRMPQESVDLVSPYFVPTAAGVEYFADLVANGVRVRVLTNSLAATDVAAVHAGYAKRRKDLLEANIVLWEMRPVSGASGGSGSGGSAPFGSSGSSLHAKTFAVDGKRIFVGSFNFDPRSARFNTELGFIIESPKMAREIETSFDDAIPKSSYEVLLSDKGSVYWVERKDARIIRHDSEPETGLFKRSLVWLLSILPIEWML
ncbi:phospholipase D family protein [Pusillimonas sp. TS35]|nr:phospholipase D family protein [Pusillimonas sp. TS35]